MFHIHVDMLKVLNIQWDENSCQNIRSHIHELITMCIQAISFVTQFKYMARALSNEHIQTSIYCSANKTDKNIRFLCKTTEIVFIQNNNNYVVYFD